MYINIHTHHPLTGGRDVLELQSLYTDFWQATLGMACSLGLHPWHLQGHEQLMVDIRQYAALPNVLAIGECGLDKVCDTDWNLQSNIFRQQIKLAGELNKPLIIHCVSAFNELLDIIDEMQVPVPLIVHGFNKKGDVSDKLLAKGIYLSFGAAILKDGSPAKAILERIPVHQFFLETDDANISITEIYHKAAEIRKTSTDAIILQLQQNFNKVFKNKTYS